MQIMNFLENDRATRDIELVLYRSSTGRISIAINSPACTFRAAILLLDGMPASAIIDIGDVEPPPFHATAKETT